MNKPLLFTDYLSDASFDCKVDGLIINSSLYSTFNDVVFSYTEIKNLVKKIKNKSFKVIINLDRIIPENEIEKFLKFLKDISELNFDYIIYSDYAVLNNIDEKFYDKLIYDPKTLICTKEELDVIPTKAFISSELSLNELADFNNAKKSIAIDAFGYRQMMYSRRPLLSLVMPKGKVKANKLYNLVEETREDNYKIYETKRNKDNYGTFVYNKGIYCLFNELKELNNIAIIRLNSMFLKDVIVAVSHEYYNLINGLNPNYQNLLKIFKDNNLEVDNPFLECESVLLKGCE